jgi:hypothetical protein
MSTRTPDIRLSARKIGPVRTANARPNPRPAAKRTILALLATTIPNAPGGNHWALHGTAINPNSGAIAEYRELSKCSDGRHCTTSNEEEVGRIFQGLGPESAILTGTNTLFFIHREQVPKHKRATHIRVAPKNRIPVACGGPPAATKLNITVASPPKQLALPPPNCYSTAFSAHPRPNL